MNSWQALLLVLSLGGCSDFLNPGSDKMRSVWLVKIDSIGPGSWLGVPATGDGRLFMAIGNRAVGLSAENGAVLWSKVISTEPGPFAERMIVREGVVFVADKLGVFALNAATGAQVWHFLPDSSARRGGVEVDDAAVYIGTLRSHVYALSRSTGSVLWDVQLHPEWQYSGIVTGITASGDTIYVGIDRFLNSFGGSSSGVIIALDRRDGDIIWEYESAGVYNNVSSFPTIKDSVLLAADRAGASFFALNRFTGKEIWRVPNSPGALGDRWAPVVMGNTAISGDGYGRVTAVDAKTGAARWKREYGTAVFGLGVCGNSLIVSNLALRRLSPSTGNQTGILEPPSNDNSGSVPVSSNGRIFIEGGKYVQAVAC